MSAATNGGNDYRDWRQEVTRQLDESAKAHRDTAVILERLKGEINAQDIRLRGLENLPNTNRANVQLILGGIGLLVALGGCTLGPIFGIVVAYLFQQAIK